MTGKTCFGSLAVRITPDRREKDVIENSQRMNICQKGEEGYLNLADAKTGEEYLVKDIVSEDEELKAFLFSLGCYSGEPITVISHIKGGCVVSIKDARYNVDTDLAKAISI